MFEMLVHRVLSVRQISSYLVCQVRLSSVLQSFDQIITVLVTRPPILHVKQC